MQERLAAAARLRQTSEMTPTDPIEDSILALTAMRGPDKSICPSEVARALCAGHEAGADEQGWRPLMTPVRLAAIRLAQAGRIDILRKGRPIAPGDVRGVIRLRMRSGA